MHHFRQGRMRENAVDELFLGGFEVHGYDESLNEFRDFRPDQVRAEKLSGFRIENGLGEPIGHAKCDGLAIPKKREAADSKLAASFLGLRLGQADGGDLRRAIGAAGNFQLVRGVRLQPLMASTQTTPSCSALCASMGGPATSPMA